MPFHSVSAPKNHRPVQMSSGSSMPGSTCSTTAPSASRSRTAWASPPGWLQTPADTARKSAPAAARPRAVSAVMPPMATQGVCIVSCQTDRISGSARVGASLVGLGKKAPKAT